MSALLDQLHREVAATMRIAACHYESARAALDRGEFIIAGFYQRVAAEDFQTLCDIRARADSLRIAESVAAVAPRDPGQFVVGTTYTTRSVCDHDTVIGLTVEARTAKTLRALIDGKPKTLRIDFHDGAERVRPWGNYSMCPVITARA